MRIKVHNLKEIKDKREVFSNVDFEIKENSLFCITGRSGVGKTTLFFSMMGLSKTTSGEIYYGNYSFHELSDKEKEAFRQKFFGFVPQQHLLIEEFSVYQNVTIPLRFSDMSKKEKQNKVKEVLIQVGLEGYETKKVSKLSIGEKQRVAIARAIIHSPKIIFADEPTASVDRHNREKILNIFKELVNKGTTVIIITHDRYVEEQCNIIYNLETREITQNDNNGFTSLIKEISRPNKKKNNYFSGLIYSFHHFQNSKARNILLIFTILISLVLTFFIQAVNRGLLNNYSEFINETSNRTLVIIDQQNRDIDDIKNITNETLHKAGNKIEKIEEIGVSQQFIKIEFNGKTHNPLNFYNNYLQEYPETVTSLPYNNPNNVILGTEKINRNGVIIPETLAKQLTEQGDLTNIIGESITLKIPTNVELKSITFEIQGILESDGNSTNYPIFISKQRYNSLSDELKRDKIYLVDMFEEVTQEDVFSLAVEANITANNPAISLSNFLNTVNAVKMLMVFLTSAFILVTLTFTSLLSYINVVQRKSEFAIFSIFGFSKFKNAQIFLFEYFLVFLVAGLTSVLLFNFLIDPINILFEQQSNLKEVLKMNSLDYLIGLSTFLLFFAIVLIIPLYKIVTNSVYKNLQ
ncbi:hypothetical protein BKP45_10640 [Anaerobacillus alkalidiazotrophicus]|uniref:ABC transporter domain-containing protein n=1 Tax=Anaerobacillus alkalidiazotrophicus TaxID=472963 RepID=A0A1S2M4V4_9BACI|nr:ATP-binding cassette domain-containing protein [Anaerobacillus alkalidiazotrophicus]OIJ18051.1 hypothetical protein BKP45_16355 [Anaerobacillus alkalidiazotrophicus]OIJ19530.1 hypothetical protein BKP45_10640 [Anaerobacillus alkalidiazotrophicus]